MAPKKRSQHSRSNRHPRSNRTQRPRKSEANTRDRTEPNGLEKAKPTPEIEPNPIAPKNDANPPRNSKPINGIGPKPTAPKKRSQHSRSNRTQRPRKTEPNGPENAKPTTPRNRTQLVAHRTQSGVGRRTDERPGVLHQEGRVVDWSSGFISWAIRSTLPWSEGIRRWVRACESLPPLGAGDRSFVDREGVLARAGRVGLAFGLGAFPSRDRAGKTPGSSSAGPAAGEKELRGEICPGVGSSLFRVEAAGIAPASREASTTASTCVADPLIVGREAPTGRVLFGLAGHEFNPGRNQRLGPGDPALASPAVSRGRRRGARP